MPSAGGVVVVSARRTSPTRAAKMEALAQWVGELPTRRLDANAYKLLAERGLSRSDVDRAVDDLVEDGRAGVSGSGGVVVVELMTSPT